MNIKNKIKLQPKALSDKEMKENLFRYMKHELRKPEYILKTMNKRIKSDI